MPVDSPTVALNFKIKRRNKHVQMTTNIIANSLTSFMGLTVGTLLMKLMSEIFVSI